VIQLAAQPQATRHPKRLDAVLDELKALSERALRRMYLPAERMFVFRLRRDGAGVAAEGVSRRYTAIALIGLAAAGPEAAAAVFGDDEARDVVRRLLNDVNRVENVGDAALTLWAALAWKDAEANRASARLAAMRPWDASIPTVELAWCLTAFSLQVREGDGDTSMARRTADRLLASVVERSGLFPHWPIGAKAPWSRRHVSCFADQVYPIQALAHFHAARGDERSAAVVRRSADRLCALQGDAGQWWWHFDARTGRVIERYPVYAVHQDAMAPMALLDLDGACGTDHRAFAARGMQWLIEPAESVSSLIDRDADLIWRKVARREPRKLVRAIQATASRIHPALRVPGMDVLFPPVATDFECRPYHLGWLLYAWAHRPLKR